MSHFISNGQPTNLVDVHVGAKANIQLWGGGPNNQKLDVTSSNSAVVRVEEVPVSNQPNIRNFSIQGVGKGSARLLAQLGPGGLVWADTRVMVGLDGYNRYYHGTNSSIADLLTSVDLTPMTLPTVLVKSFDWTDYTDFGKGFYVHLESNRTMAYEWAKRRFSADWSVVEFIAIDDELRDLATTSLFFQTKSDRPHNSPRAVTVSQVTRSASWCPVPQLLPCIEVSQQTTSASVGTNLSWLEFVEYNRHIERRKALIARPNDRDWTSNYSSIRGPIWVPRDSGFNAGLPVFPGNIHQLNWGLSGMKMLNAADVKSRRFKFSGQNEGLFPSPS